MRDSSNPFDSHQAGSWNSDIPENRGLSKFSKFLAVIFLLLGLLGIIGGAMGASFKALQLMGFDIASAMKGSVDTASPKPATEEPQADSQSSQSTTRYQKRTLQSKPTLLLKPPPKDLTFQIQRFCNRPSPMG